MEANRYHIDKDSGIHEGFGSAGADLATLELMQTHQAEGENLLAPSDIAGVSNDPVLSLADLTAKVASLEFQLKICFDCIMGLEALVKGGAQ